MNSRPRTPIHEVFASIQGEGLFVGQPQVFVRLDGCPLRCAWCDTPETWGLPSAERSGANWDAGRTRSWCTAGEVARYIEELDPSGRKTLSVTGGEPLMWPEFLKELRAAFPDRRLHLETAGAFPRSLEAVLPHVDHVSADLKLPQDLAPPVPLHGSPDSHETAPANASEWAAARRAVLALLSDRAACLKLILAGGHTPDVYEELLDDVARLAPALPLFLQPATPIRATLAPDEDLVARVAEAGLARGLELRVLPQLHVLLGIR